MKKQLDETTIANELRGASAYFSGARTTTHEERDEPSQPIDRTDDRSVKRSVQRSAGQPRAPKVAPAVEVPSEGHTVMEEVQGGAIPEVRPTERYAFEIYTDQKRQLNRIRYLYQEKTGKQLAASRILREAIGPYLDTLEDELTKP